MTISRAIVRLQLLWQHLSAKLRRRKFQPLDSLDADTLAKIHSEAAMLRSRYGVEVRALAAGEKPDIPQPAQKSDHSTFQP